MSTNPGRTARQLAAWNRWHWILAILLILLLLVLWAMGHGPASCAPGWGC